MEVLRYVTDTAPMIIHVTVHSTMKGKKTIQAML
jgi:hypothetical protein